MSDLNDDQRRAWIDGASYKELLTKWRHETVPSPWFTGSLGVYFHHALINARDKIGAEEAARISKEIGFEPRSLAGE